jgi:phospholipid/cholesterol/gamma-HCH transport system ATP-binding protein
MIELRNVSKRFGDLVVLDGVDFDVRKGETVALLGPSGVGKSVLLKHINGLIHPDRGEVWVDGQNVTRAPRRELAKLRSRIGYVFQYGALFDSMTVSDNVRLGITDEAAADDQAYCRDRVRQCLQLVNLDPAVGEKFPAELSGGMRKRVGIARAIAGQPTYLLWDEPTSGLDPVNADIIDSLVEKLDDELGVTSVVVTHDVRGAFRVADRIAMLMEGRIRAMGTPAELRASTDAAVQEFLERDLTIPVHHASGPWILPTSRS